MANNTGKKFGGRTKGTPNKTTTEIRQAFNELISSKLPELSKWLDDVANDNPEKALELIIRFSDFIIPKLQRTEISIDPTRLMTPEQRKARIDELTKKLKKAE